MRPEETKLEETVTVRIDGITLTRSQVERALAELNRPKSVVFRPGDRVRHKDSFGSVRKEYIVASDSLRQLALKEYRSVISQTDLVVVSVAGGELYNGAPNTYEKVK